MSFAVNKCRRVALSSLFSKPKSWTVGPSTTLAARVQCQEPRLWRAYGNATAGSSTQQVRREGPKWEEVTLQETEEPTTQHTQLESKKLKTGLRALLRDIAQPVAVVTSFMPNSTSDSFTSFLPASNDKDNGCIYHGATLSSFTSIAMDPYPLVAFALRIPSRMASALSALSSSSSSSSQEAYMVINLLSVSQASTAVTFSRPDLHPTPFLGSPTSGTYGISYTLSQDGLPIINDVIGALSCRLVGGPIPLHDLDYLEKIKADPSMPVLGKGDVASELFIARVVRVERVGNEAEGLEEADRRTLPLLYHRRRYTSCQTKSS